MVISTVDNSIAQKIDYDEYGNVYQDTNLGFQPFAYVGGVYDQYTKMIMFGARDYDATAGRWISKDPILFDGDGPNLYGYVLSDPVNLFDINGTTCYSYKSILNLPKEIQDQIPQWMKELILWTCIDCPFKPCLGIELEIREEGLGANKYSVTMYGFCLAGSF
jgi:RHS repeat-associated protein